MTREQDIKQTRREGTRGGIRGEGGAGGDQYDQTVAELTSAYGAHPPVVSCKVLYQIPLSATFPGFPKPRHLCFRLPNGWRMGAMRPPVQLREDYDAPDLRVLAKASRDANQTRRLLTLAAIYDGASRREAAKIGGVGVQPFDKLRSAGLGTGLQRRRSARADRRQSAGPPAAVECRAARGLAADH